MSKKNKRANKSGGKSAKSAKATAAAARRTARDQRRRATAVVDPALVESQAAEAATVAWMLSVLATLLALLAAGLANWLLQSFGDGGDPGKLLPLLPGILFFTSLVTGMIDLLLLPAIYLVRRIPPPPTITLAAVMIGLAPLFLMFSRVMG